MQWAGNTLELFQESTKDLHEYKEREEMKEDTCQDCGGELKVFGLNHDHEDVIMKCEKCGQIVHQFSNKTVNITKEWKEK